MPSQATFIWAFLLLALSLPQAMESFAVWRSYFWQMAAIGTLALVARHVASCRVDLHWRRDCDLAALASIATATAIGLHYVGGLFGGSAGAIALCALARGLRRWATLMLATATLSCLFVLACLLLQLIQPGAWQGLRVRLGAVAYGTPADGQACRRRGRQLAAQASPGTAPGSGLLRSRCPSRPPRSRPCSRCCRCTGCGRW